jgi:hypothetical protein
MPKLQMLQDDKPGYTPLEAVPGGQAVHTDGWVGSM